MGCRGVGLQGYRGSGAQGSRGLIPNPPKPLSRPYGLGILGFPEGFGMILTEVVVALGMRWLRQQKGSDEGGWTPLAIGV